MASSSTCLSPRRTLTNCDDTSSRTTATWCQIMKPPRPHTPWPNPRRTARPARWRPTGSGNVSARDEWSLPANRTKINQAQKDKFLTRVLITPELILNLKGFEKKSQVSTQKDFWFSRKYRPVYWKDYFQDFKHSSHSRDNTIGLSFKKQTEAENHFRSHPLTIYHWKKKYQKCLCIFTKWTSGKTLWCQRTWLHWQQQQEPSWVT